ncbi:hypothetical protein [Pseudomonas sp. 6D_7.1_Bac1]|uniref:DUF6630 family protein n=1 Tax=Pseudomonas sp. 6D_7.1_Bac1 TaxID=2971615 RepID=UPI0021C8955D|nr:hypothetical protein [Pseudomonas sp. 6D_7.1_Bac1]MCU1752784.1 hypothetical protein [Pseudomonas sp. 6D_7.1_Bac1]
MPEILNSLDKWLVPFGKRYLHFDAGGDSYEGVIVDSEKVQQITELAKRAGVNVSLDHF